MTRRRFLFAGGAALSLVGVAVPLACGAEPQRPIIQSSDVVAWFGGNDVVEAQHDACLETFLTLGLPATEVRYRSLAWEGDSVFEQPRDVNFGAWPQHLRRAGATILVLQFGQSEALAGVADLSRFIGAYEGFVKSLRAHTGRVVLISPTPFERSENVLPDLSTRNSELRRFVDAIALLASRLGCPFIDMFKPLVRELRGNERLTTNGRHLSSAGHWLAARTVARELGAGAILRRIERSSTGNLKPGSVEELRQSIRKKNRLWFDYWRPMNWAFLNGDRIEQPSSRDHRNPAVRWFPAELEQFLPLIQAEERRIASLAVVARRELGAVSKRAG